MREAGNNNPAFTDGLAFVENKERILIIMSDVMEKIIEQKLHEQEDLTVVELTEQELDEVTGAWFPYCFPFSTSTSLAVTSIAFTNNNNGFI